MTIIKTAIPYYGSLTYAGKGFERIFFLLEYDDRSGNTSNVNMGVWDASEQPLLAAWLISLNVKQLVCTQMPEKGLKESMLKSGICVMNAADESASKILSTLCLI
ncbi:MAG: hypothetical protein PHN92_06340 [Geobacter sp.]|nr:hypothetical protein [Geobacter sp.]